MTGISGCGSASFVQLIQQMFQKVDTNGDGVISLSEFQSAMKAQSNGGRDAGQADSAAAVLFTALDTNGDGSSLVLNSFWRFSILDRLRTAGCLPACVNSRRKVPGHLFE